MAQTQQEQLSFPIISEIWAVLEGSLQAQARKLVDDIAKAEKADAKELWKLVKPQIRIGLLDIDLDDEAPTYCPYPLGSDGAVAVRCRAPCLLGFKACSRHINIPVAQSPTEELIKVRRVFDFEDHTYFAVETGKSGEFLAKDKNDNTEGIIQDGVLYKFSVKEKQEK
jgi:hypothetical protein